MRLVTKIVFSALLAIAAGEAIAIDVGDPTFPALEEPTSRFEIVYESMSRDVWVGFERARLGTPAGGPILIANQEPPRFLAREEADFLLGRWVHHPVDFISTQFDFGLSDESTAGDTQIVIGGAVKMLLTESGPFQLVSQFDAHFIPEFRTTKRVPRRPVARTQRTGTTMPTSSVPRCWHRSRPRQAAVLA